MESFLANRPKGSGFSRPIPRSVSGTRNNALRPFASGAPAPRNLREAGEDSTVPSSHPAESVGGGCAPGRVEVDRDVDGVVRRIIVHCGCGQQVPVDCEY